MSTLIFLIAGFFILIIVGYKLLLLSLGKVESLRVHEGSAEKNKVSMSHFSRFLVVSKYYQGESSRLIHEVTQNMIRNWNPLLD